MSINDLHGHGITITDERTSLLTADNNVPIAQDSERGEGWPRRTLSRLESVQPLLTCLLLMFLMQAGLEASLAPTTAILEDIICRAHYKHHSEGLAEAAAALQQQSCKIEPVQSALATLRGVYALFCRVPGIIFVVPYSLLANKYGILHVMLWATIGTLLADFWYALVCWQGDTWPYQFIWISAAFYLIGGGPAVFITLLYNFVANISSAETRESRFFQLEAAACLGNIFGYLMGSMLAHYGVWIPILLGLLLECSVIMLLLFSPVTIPSGSYADPDPVSNAPVSASLDSIGSTSESSTTLEVKNTIHATWQILTTEKVLLILTLGFFLRMLSVSIIQLLLLLYISQRLNWDYSQAAYLLTLDNAVHLLVLLVLSLPFIDTLLASSLSLGNVAKDVWLARSSNLFSAIGCAGVAMSYSPAPMITSIIVYGLGTGYAASTRGLLTQLTSPQHRTLMLSILTMLETAGTLLGAPLWPTIYSAGLKLGGIFVGLPFAVAAVTLLLVSMSIEISHYMHRRHEQTMRRSSTRP